jgi:subtilisin family serine protease
MGGVPGAQGDGPKEGDIKLRDAQGRWYLVQGIPTRVRPYNHESITIAVIDSGVLPDHPQVAGSIAEQRDFTGEGPKDRIGHGTIETILCLAPALANIPKDIRKKVAPPRVIEAKVANADGSIDKNAVIHAIQWAAQRGAKVVNLSLGFREGTDDYSGLCDVIARNPKIIFVAAAGNFGPAIKVYPAACKSDNLISVSATDPDGYLARYSGIGDIAAPGTIYLGPEKTEH